MEKTRSDEAQTLELVSASPASSERSLAVRPDDARSWTVETVVWSGRPSLWIAAPRVLKWSVILAVGVALVHGWAPWGMSVPARPDWLPLWATDWRLWALFPLWRMVDTVLELACIRYELTAEHLRIRTGILSRWTEEQELYRIKKLSLWEPLLMRVFGRADVVLHTADPGVQRLALRGVPQAAALRQRLHELVDGARDRRRVHVGESI